MFVIVPLKKIRDLFANFFVMTSEILSAKDVLIKFNLVKHQKGYIIPWPLCLQQMSP